MIPDSEMHDDYEPRPLAALSGSPPHDPKRTATADEGPEDIARQIDRLNKMGLTELAKRVWERYVSG